MRVLYLQDEPEKFVLKDSYRLNGGLCFMMLMGVGLILLSIFIMYSAFQSAAFAKMDISDYAVIIFANDQSITTYTNYS